MSYRESTHSNLDHNIFHHTAKITKKINVSPKQMRGGIRL